MWVVVESFILQKLFLSDSDSNITYSVFKESLLMILEAKCLSIVGIRSWCLKMFGRNVLHEVYSRSEFFALRNIFFLLTLSLINKLFKYKIELGIKQNIPRTIFQKTSCYKCNKTQTHTSLIQEKVLNPQRPLPGF